VASNDREEALRRIAQDPQAHAAHLAKIQGRLRQLHGDLEILAREMSVVVRGTHVDGDGWRDAGRRARPVERAYGRLLRNCGRVIADLERAAYARNAFSDKVNALPGIRAQKALEKAARKAPPQLTAPNTVQEVQHPPTQGDAPDQNSGYDGPRSLSEVKWQGRRTA